MLKYLSVFLLSGALLACGGGYNPDLAAQQQVSESQKLGNQKAEVVSEAGNLRFTKGALAGTGAIRFTELLSKPESAHNFTLNFNLDEGSSVTLITNSSKDLSKGVEVKFSRPSESNSLSVVVKAGNDTFDMSDFFASLDSSKALSISMDIHNNHGATVHILFWDENSNSEEIVDDLLNGRGFGSNWGLILQNARISNIMKSPPRYEH